ncbi:MAG: glycine cleavage system aminomethyltransferase GcvT [Candidatus Caldarchaeum sp.]
MEGAAEEAGVKEIPLLKHHLSSPRAEAGEFAGWKTIISFTTVREEHNAVRERAGIFDISHMTRVKVSGPGATSFLQKVVTADVEKLKPGRMKYALILNEQAGIIDDVTVFKVSENSYLMVSNAVTRTRVLEWLGVHAGEDVHVWDFTDSSAFFAVQGPKAVEFVSKFFGKDFTSFKWFSGEFATVNGCQILMTRSGYTGGDGFELIIPCGGPSLYGKVWDRFVEEGAQPCGLACRDVCRLEAGYLLSGQDFDESKSPLETKLMWAVNLEKPGFIGKQALERKLIAKLEKVVTLLEMVEPGVPRHGYMLVDEKGRKVGEVTSGGAIPSTGKAAAIGYVVPELSQEGCEVFVDIRGKIRKARVRAMPFITFTKP